MNPSSAITSQVEIWQAQTYWPIKGWAAPLSGAPHYSCLLLTSGVADSFPNDLLPPVGWKWLEDWALDTSSQYGSPDSEGWFYAPSFDRLHEQMRNSSASGLAATTCTVRKRRWVRSITCISSDLQSKIRSRAEQIVQMRVNIEQSMKNKEASLKELTTYEEKRVAVFAQSLHMATQKTLNTLGILKDISSKMKVVKQYVSDRALMEREHSLQLEKLALKYAPLDSLDGSQTPTGGSSGKLQGGEELVSSLTKAVLSPPAVLSEDGAAARSSHCTAGADLFFNKIVSATRSQAESLDEYSRNILPLLSEMDALLTEIQEILKDARGRFRKNSDICRLSEAAILNFQSSVQYAFSSVSQVALREVGQLTEELTCLRGGLPYHPSIYDRISSGDFARPFDFGPAHAHAQSSQSSSNAAVGPGGVQKVTAAMKKSMKLSTSANASTTSTEAPAPAAHGAAGSSSSSHEDFWLSTQRYKVSVRDAQEALAVLVSEYMDIDLQQQIISNRAYTLLTRLSALYAEEEVVLYETLRAIYRREMKGLVSEIKSLGLPHVTLLSPFEKLNPQGEEGAPEYRDFINAQGVFAFTSLYRTPLPTGPGVVKSGRLYAVPSAEVRTLLQSNSAAASSNNSYDYIISNSPARNTKTSSAQLLDWKEVYIVCTSDGYVHVLLEKVCDIPDRSFFLKHSVLREFTPTVAPLYHHAFELSTSPKHLSTAQETSANTTANKRRGSKGNMLHGLVFRSADGGNLDAWLQLFRSLSSCPVATDTYLDAQTQEAMLQSLPILRGETAQIDLNLNTDYLDSIGGDAATEEPRRRRRKGKKGTFVAGEGAASQSDGDTSSDYGDLEDGDEADEAQTYSQSDTLSASTLKKLDGGFSDDESDYPASAATTPFTPFVRNEREESDSGALGSMTSPPKTPFTDQAEDRSLPAGGQAEDGSHGQAASRGGAAGGNEVTPPPIRSIRKLSAHLTTSKYEKRDAGSWIKKQQEEAAPRVISVGILPVAEVKPVQLIPRMDKQMPLAKRHSQMIKQYEQGLQHEKQKSTLKVQETRGQRLRDFGIDEIVGDEASGPNTDAPASTEGAEPAALTVTTSGATEQQDVVGALPVTPLAKSARTLGVKRLSKMFDAKDAAALRQLEISSGTAATSASAASTPNAAAATAAAATAAEAESSGAV